MDAFLLLPPSEVDAVLKKQTFLEKIKRERLESIVNYHVLALITWPTQQWRETRS